MTKKEIISLGKSLGLKLSSKDTCISTTYVAFEGVNGQRFGFETSWKPKETYAKFGEALRLIGRRQLKVELGELLNITSDN